MDNTFRTNGKIDTSGTSLFRIFKGMVKLSTPKDPERSRQEHITGAFGYFCGFRIISTLGPASFGPHNDCNFLTATNALFGLRRKHSRITPSPSTSTIVNKFQQFCTNLTQLCGSFLQSMLHRNLSQAIHPIGGVRTRKGYSVEDNTTHKTDTSSYTHQDRCPARSSAGTQVTQRDSKMQRDP